MYIYKRQNMVTSKFYFGNDNGQPINTNSKVFFFLNTVHSQKDIFIYIKNCLNKFWWILYKIKVYLLYH